MISMKKKRIISFLLVFIMMITSLVCMNNTGLVSKAYGEGFSHASQFKDRRVYKGIDVSQYQGTIDWNKVSESGVEFVLVRLAYRDWYTGEFGQDTTGVKNCIEAKKAGLKVGAYIRSQATTKQEAIEEADYISNIIRTNSISLDLPVVMDYEYHSSMTQAGNVHDGKLYDAKLSKQQATDVCMTFCEKIADYGYEPMVYANRWMLTNCLDADTISSKYNIWLAEYKNKPDDVKYTDYAGEYSFWQYSNTGTVPGISTRVDLDFYYSMEPSLEKAKIMYSSHIQTYGWEKIVHYDGAMSGTQGQGKRLEAIKIQNISDVDGSIEYQVHCQTYGWLNWVKDGAVAGKTGEGKRLEAIRIRLTGDLEKTYDVYYRVHAQTFGWMGWAKNGQTAGTTNYAKRLEAIEIRLVEKGGTAPGSSDRYYISPGNVAYKTHVQSFGWQGNVYDGATSGTTGRAKRLEAITIRNLSEYDGDISYRVHVQTYGWQSWKKNGEIAGTTGQAKRLEAIQIQLSGELAEHYDIYYRVHAQTFGWLDWACNGEPAGTARMAKRLEAIQIKLVPKNGPAPGSTARAYVGPPVSIP